MDQTVINATSEFLNTQIATLQQTIKSKDEHIHRITQRDYATAAQLQTVRDAMYSWVMSELENNEITSGQAEEIALVCGFELTKEVEAEVSVTYNVTIQVPIGEDAEDIINDIDFESVSYNSDNITWLSASIDRIDI